MQTTRRCYTANGWGSKAYRVGSEPEIIKYENYQKFDVHTGQNISHIYLQIPNGLSKEEFQDTLKYFRENGAKFNSYKKAWYIEPGKEENFKDYLPQEQELEGKAANPEQVQNSKAKCLGYAYMQNSEKPKVMYGENQEEILQKLQEWNKTRSNGFTYDTCNIGTYNASIDKYVIISGRRPRC